MSTTNDAYCRPITAKAFYDDIDEEQYGCKVTDIERLELAKMKERIKRRICTVVDEEVKATVYKLKTGKDFYK